MKNIKYNIKDNKDRLIANEFVKYFCDKNNYKLLGGVPMTQTNLGWVEMGYMEIQKQLIKELEINFDIVTVKMVQDCIYFLTKTAEDKGMVTYLDEINPYHMHLIDGIYDVKKKVFIKYEGSQLHTIKNILPYTYKDCVSKKSPVSFISFLKQIFDGESDIKDNISFIQEFIGLLLIPNTLFEKALYIFGTGGNGKGTLFTTIQEVLGKNNCSAAGLNELGDRTNLYGLLGKLCNIDYDLYKHAYIDKEIIKKIISGERVVVKQLYQQPFPFKPFARIICAANYMPKVVHVDRSVARRYFFLELKNNFVGHEDINLKQNLPKEKKLIFAWALKGLYRLMLNGKFTLSKQILENKYKFLNE